MIRTARLIAAKDLRLELRSRIGVIQIVPFAMLVLLLFGFGLDADRPMLLIPVAPAVFWIAVLLSLLLMVGRTFAIETADGAFDAIRMSRLDPAGVFLGKAAALFVQLLVLITVLLLGVIVLYDVLIRPGGGLVLLVTSAVLTGVGLAAVGTLYGALSAGATVRETLLPLLLLPVAAPVLIGATKAFEAALGTGQSSLSDGWPWVGLIAVFALVYVAAGIVAFGPLLEDS
jgi:heme exporter protein B